MTNMIKWKVQEKPTGPYRSFERRGWPCAEHRETGRTLFQIECEDDYTNGKTPHSLLSLAIAKSNGNYKSGWGWVTLRQTFNDLVSLKLKAKEIFEQKPEWFI